MRIIDSDGDYDGDDDFFCNNDADAAAEDGYNEDNDDKRFNLVHGASDEIDDHDNDNYDDYDNDVGYDDHDDIMMTSFCVLVINI